MQHTDHADDRREQRHDEPEAEPELAGQGIHPRVHPIEPGTYLLEPDIYLFEPGVDLRKPGVHLCADAISRIPHTFAVRSGVVRASFVALVRNAG